MGIRLVLGYIHQDSFITATRYALVSGHPVRATMLAMLGVVFGHLQ